MLYYKVSLKGKRSLPIAEGITATLLKASSLLVRIFLQLIVFFPPNIEKHLIWGSAPVLAAVLLFKGWGPFTVWWMMPMLENLEKSEHLSQARACGCVYSLTVGKHSLGLCRLVVCQHIDKFHGSGEAGDCLPYAVWVRSYWVWRKSLRHKIWTLTLLTE